MDLDSITKVVTESAERKVAEVEQDARRALRTIADNAQLQDDSREVEWLLARVLQGDKESRSQLVRQLSTSYLRQLVNTAAGEFHQAKPKRGRTRKTKPAEGVTDAPAE